VHKRFAKCIERSEFTAFQILLLIGALSLLTLFCSKQRVPTDPLGLIEEEEIEPVDRNYNPHVEFCTWFQNKKAAYTIAFDDARESHYLISAPELEKRGMVGTFNLNTGTITNWQPWQQLFDHGHEIGSHSRTHPRFTDLSEEEMRKELFMAKFDILENIKGATGVPSFAFPYGLSNDLALRVVPDFHLTARVGGGINKAELADNDFNKIRGIGVYPPYDINALNSKVQEAIRNKGWIIVYFHSVSAEEKSDVCTVPLSFFKRHLDFVSSLKDSLWIATQGEVARYIKAREMNRLTVRIVSNRIIKVKALADSFYPETGRKISFTLNMPGRWQHKKISVQNKNRQTYSVIKACDKKAIFSITPGSTLSIFAQKGY